MRLGEIERVEDRVLLAGNLMVSAEYLVDAAGVPMPAGQTPAVGEAVYVRVDWQESGLTTSDHYQLGYQLNQNTSTGAPPAGFFAGTGTTTDRSFTAFVGYAISVGNVVQVTLDVGQTVAESNETVRDNVISLVFNSTEPFNPATPSLNLPQQLVTPVTGIPYQDWYISYSDWDPRPVTALSPDLYQDFLGGKATSDGQFGDRYILANFNDMDNGRVSAVAVAPATVISVVDGNFDRETTSSNRPGNSVLLDLGNGWTALYSNLLSGSITVKVGDIVSTNDVIGLLGSSGDSTRPGLTFKLMRNGQVVEPNYVASTYFANPMPYSTTAPFSIISSGITNSDPAPDMLERPQDYTTFSTSTSSTIVWLWLQSNRNLFNEPITVTWYNPSGGVASTTSFNPPKSNVGVPNIFSLDNSVYKGAVGTWQVAVTVKGTELLRKSFTVAASAGAPEIRLQQEPPTGQSTPPIQILSDRTTPVDFGTLSGADPVYDITFTIQNSGASALTITNFNVPDGFVASINILATVTIQAGSFSQFTIQQVKAFNPLQSFGNVTFTTNAPDERTFRFPVTGFINETLDGPDVDLPGPATRYVFQAPPKIIAPDAQILTPGFASGDGSTLDVVFASGGRTEDVLGIRNQGVGAGQIGVSGANVTYGSIVIGKFAITNDVTSGAKTLRVTFNDKYSVAVGTALMQNVTYSNLSVVPNTHPRYVQFLMNRGGFDSDSPFKVIDVVPDTRPPAVNLLITPVTTPGALTQDFQLVYTDEAGVDGSTPDGKDILTIQGPNGALFTPQFLSKDSSANGIQRTTSWTLAGPGGFWDVRDNGVYTVKLNPNEVKDINGNTSPGQIIGTFTINLPNKPPVFTNSISGQFTLEDTPSEMISIKVDDLETDAGLLQLTATSSDTSIVAANGFTFGGSGTDRTLIITPAPNGFGNATITLQLLDAHGGITTKSFQMSVQAVNDLPVISTIADQDIQQDTATPIINFTATDIETAAGALTVVATSDNQSLIKNSNVVLGGTSANRTLVITPEAGKFGRANITVKVTDADGGISTEVFSVLVRENSLPPVFTANQVFNVPENSNVGTPVGQVAATDPDAGQTLTYAITGGDPNNAFTIDPATGLLKVLTPSLFDFETLSKYTLNIAVTDSSFPGVTTTGLVTVNVTNVNEAPVVQDKSINLTENPPNGQTVTVVTATDVDSGQTRAFSIAGGNPNNAFVINSTTGALSVNNSSAIDFEATPIITLTIASTDNGAPSQTGFGTVTIHLGNVNEAPTINAQSLSVKENSPNGSAVGTVIAVDPDNGQSLTYSIVSGNADGAFAIDPTTGALTVADSSALNFELQASHQLVVKVADNASSAASASNVVTISIVDVNEPPVIAPQSFTLNEASALNTPVGTVVTGNPEVSQTLQFSITAGNTGGAFAINTTTGAIRVANTAAVNFETTPQFTLTITATDSGNPALASTGTVTVVLNDINEAPLIQNQNFAINENLALGAVAANVAASDADSGQSLTFSITNSTVPGIFTIDPQTGAILVADQADLNFEMHPVINLTVKVTDNGSPALASSAVITLNLKDVNDTPVVPPQTVTFDENQTSGFVVAFANATDEDIPAQTLTYSIVGGNVGGAFAIDATTGKITAVNPAAVDFETSPQFLLQVQARDNGASPRSGVGIITINLNDVNEPPIVPTQTLSVPENSPIGFVVGQITVNNPEPNQTLNYRVLSGNEAGVFAIDTSTGQITVVKPQFLNFENPQTFVMSGQVTDNGNPALTQTGQLTINVSDVNEEPVFAGTPFTFTVDENSSNGSVVGTIHATDPDNGQTVQYTITGGNVGNAFTLNPTTGVLTVAKSTMLDFETNPVFNLTIQAFDDGTLRRTIDSAVTINLRDVNDAPKVVEQTIQIDENSPASAVIGTVSATDQDSGQTVTFQIDSGNVDGAFAIDPVTGVLTIANSQAIDFETHSVFHLVIRATDNASPTTASSTGVVNVSLRNVNEPPVIPTQTLSVPENSRQGTLVGAVAAHDPEPGQTILFAIVSGNQNGAFTINANSGVLTVANPDALDFETGPLITIVIKGTDNANPALSSTGIVRVNVLNVDEPPEISNQVLTIPENAPNGTIVGVVEATDPDETIGLLYEVSAGNQGDAFRVDPLTGELIVNKSAFLNFEQRQVIILSVRTTDSSGLSDSATITINLTNANDPPVISDAVFSIAENSIAGTVVGTMIATEEDIGQRITFSIVSGNGNNAFGIDPKTGKITVANPAALDFETTPTFALGIKTSDNGSPVADRVAIATINLTNVDEPVTIEFQPDAVPVRSGQKNVVIDSQAIARDVDSDATSLLGVTMTVSLSKDTSVRADKLNLFTSATDLTLNGKNVIFNGHQVATVVGGKAGSPLYISFTADATTEALQAIVRAVAISLGKKHKTDTMDVKFRMSGTPGATSGPAIKTMTFIPPVQQNIAKVSKRGQGLRPEFSGPIRY